MLMWMSPLNYQCIYFRSAIELDSLGILVYPKKGARSRDVLADLMKLKHLLFLYLS